MCAAFDGKTAAVEALLHLGADINAADEKGWTPLINAAAHNHEDVVEMLILKGADVHARTHDGETALSIAELFGRTDMANRLR